jgi:hypothetical protein
VSGELALEQAMDLLYEDVMLNVYSYFEGSCTNGNDVVAADGHNLCHDSVPIMRGN